ncbi:hypothetical protein PR048_028090 [Dryococelus australis]|uniref:Uncharacterized protein n=1 Tax=Dryococelus australis TaxID=614101 RepID=A0ABQ9GI98_9NEOP|nr:hypothetical protein PR048_028090 [Dryococelus australis]
MYRGMLEGPELVFESSICKTRAGMQEKGKRETPEKRRQPAASSGTIPTCENPGVARPGIEPGSP